MHATGFVVQRTPMRALTPIATLRGLWKLPELWTRGRMRAHKLLGRRQTDAGAHSYHRPRLGTSTRRRKGGNKLH